MRKLMISAVMALAVPAVAASKSDWKVKSYKDSFTEERWYEASTMTQPSDYGIGGGGALSVVCDTDGKVYIDTFLGPYSDLGIGSPTVYFKIDGRKPISFPGRVIHNYHTARVRNDELPEMIAQARKSLEVRVIPAHKPPRTESFSVTGSAKAIAEVVRHCS